MEWQKCNINKFNNKKIKTISLYIANNIMSLRKILNYGLEPNTLKIRFAFIFLSPI